MRRIHYILGKILGRRYRLRYWRRHDGTWLWGIVSFLIERHNIEPTVASGYDFSFLNDIFNSDERT